MHQPQSSSPKPQHRWSLEEDRWPSAGHGRAFLLMVELDKGGHWAEQMSTSADEAGESV